MSDKLDKIDLKILKILQENSKITNLDLSKKIGLSPAPTLERVKKLEQNDAKDKGQKKRSATFYLTLNQPPRVQMYVFFHRSI